MVTFSPAPATIVASSGHPLRGDRRRCQQPAANLGVFAYQLAGNAHPWAKASGFLSSNTRWMRDGGRWPASVSPFPARV